MVVRARENIAIPATPIQQLKVRRVTDESERSSQGVRRRSLLTYGGMAVAGALGTVAALAFDDTRKILGLAGRDNVNDALEDFTSRNGPVSVSQQRLLTTSFVAYVRATLRRGDPAPAEGCTAMADLPTAWDPVTPESEVYLTLSPTRDDVVLVGFEVTEVKRRRLGQRIIVGCEGGGNGAPSGFEVRDTEEGVRVTPIGPGSQSGKMRLFLSPGEDYNIAVWFSTETQQITTWFGELIFRYGNGGSESFRLPVGPATTSGRPENARTFTVEGGRWR